MAFAQDAMTISWDMALACAFPPIALISRVLERITNSKSCVMILITPRWPRQPWFPRLLSPGRRGGSSSSPQGPHPDRRRSPSSSPDSSGTESDCIADFIRSYMEAGLSSEAAAIPGEARRPSTRRTYNTRIRKYFKWCRRAAVNPHSASLGQVCDFFTAIFKEEGTTAYSVRSCRTAVAVVHHGFGGGNSIELAGHPRLD